MQEEMELFEKGIQAFNERKFYDAHEFWEELWLEHKLEDAKFIQGLIQLAVSYFHLFNQNLNGARSMIRKSLGKFDAFKKERGIDVLNLISEVEKVQFHFNEISECSEFKETYVLILKGIHE